MVLRREGDDCELDWCLSLDFFEALEAGTITGWDGCWLDGWTLRRGRAGFTGTVSYVTISSIILTSGGLQGIVIPLGS